MSLFPFFEASRFARDRPLKRKKPQPAFADYG
jgi:hypothetical protein